MNKKHVIKFFLEFFILCFSIFIISVFFKEATQRLCTPSYEISSNSLIYSKEVEIKAALPLEDPITETSRSNRLAVESFNTKKPARSVSPSITPGPQGLSSTTVSGIAGPKQLDLSKEPSNGFDEGPSDKPIPNVSDLDIPNVDDTATTQSSILSGSVYTQIERIIEPLPTVKEPLKEKTSLNSSTTNEGFSESTKKVCNDGAKDPSSIAETLDKKTSVEPEVKPTEYLVIEGPEPSKKSSKTTEPKQPSPKVAFPNITVVDFQKRAEAGSLENQEKKEIALPKIYPTNLAQEKDTENEIPKRKIKTKNPDKIVPLNQIEDNKKIAKDPSNLGHSNIVESENSSSTTKVKSTKKSSKKTDHSLATKVSSSSISDTEDQRKASILKNSKDEAYTKPEKLHHSYARSSLENKTEVIVESPTTNSKGKIKITINLPANTSQESDIPLIDGQKSDSKCLKHPVCAQELKARKSSCCQEDHCCLKAPYHRKPDCCREAPCCQQVLRCHESGCHQEVPCCQEPGCCEQVPLCQKPECCQETPYYLEPPIDQVYYRSEVSKCCGAYFTAAFIYWSTYQEGLSFAVSGFGVGVEKGCVSDVKWKWKPGYIIGIGYDLGCCWNLNADYTWIQSCNGKEITQEPFYVQVDNCDCGTGAATTTVAETSLVSYWNVNNEFHNNLTSAEACCDVFFNDIHLDFEKLFCINSCLRMKLLFGLQGAWIYQDYHVKYRNTLNEQANLYMSQDFWGIGPRGGIEMSWYFGRRFSLFADIAFSSIWNCFDVSRKDQEISAENPNKVLINTRQTLYGIDPVMNMGVGLRAENCYFTLEIGWQSQIWFDHNKYIKFSPGHDGDLIMQGLTMEVRFMF